ncbi:MAG TPA: hypothetical protein PK095_12725, partial [Myxococcota bacterium]|nr:hypothetical protein [Myxococcota bacterium]
STPEPRPSLGAVLTIADLPFHSAPPDGLLGIDWGRPGFVDEDHLGFGWGKVPRLELIGVSDRSARLLLNPLVLALHSAERDEDEDPDTPFDLELVVDGERLHLPLDRFLAVWLPKLPPSLDVVLALCNPTGFRFSRPPLPDGARCWAALGDVDSSARLDPTTQETTWALSARSWFNP